MSKKSKFVTGALVLMSVFCWMTVDANAKGGGGGGGGNRGGGGGGGGGFHGGGGGGGGYRGGGGGGGGYRGGGGGGGFNGGGGGGYRGGGGGGGYRAPAPVNRGPAYNPAPVNRAPAYRPAPVNNYRQPNFNQRPQVSPQRPQVSPQRPQVSPQRPQVSPQRPQVSPQRPQVGPQRPQVGPQRPPVGPQRPPVNTQRPGNNNPGRPNVSVPPVHGGTTNINRPRTIPNTAKRVQVGRPTTQPVHNHVAPRPTRDTYCVQGRYNGHYHAPRNCYYNTGFYFGGYHYNHHPFFCFNTYCPTAWIYYGNNSWFNAGSGWYYQPPTNYNAPISIVVDEQVVDAQGNVDTVTYYYNAYWYAAYGKYGYVDYLGNFRWLTW